MFDIGEPINHQNLMKSIIFHSDTMSVSDTFAVAPLDTMAGTWPMLREDFIFYCEKNKNV